MTLGALVGVAFAVVSALCLAAQSLTVRLGAKTHSITEVIAVMYVVNLVVFVPIAAILAYPEYGVSWTALAAFTVSGLLGSLIARYCYFIGIERLGSSRTEPLKALLPLFAVGAAVLFLGEQVTPILLVGVALLVAGGIAVTLEARNNPAAPGGREFWVALAFPLAAALFLGIDPIFTKVGFAEGTSVMVGVTIRVLAAAGGFGCYLLWLALWSGYDGGGIELNRWLLAASVANTAYLLTYYAALSRAPVSVVTPVMGASTLFVVGGAALFLQGEERVTWRLGAAAATVVLGVVLVVQG